ncbi:hypothetical protein P3T76_015097 [Phytophthora citrophthora]|uniref:AB hydrolase-1 domain-containing protein n=1 Tax=Phytophthora citrophthora TaxID=4793 RepID=A0AAD9LAI1_9STRA|nr:hypothetical protein P3T76_015097 [Phytophthora citrophthora]
MLAPIKFSGKTVDSQEFFWHERPLRQLGFRLQPEAGSLGSPGGSAIRLEELPACMDDIRFQIDNQTAAFSVTSTANDLAAIIDYELSDQVVYVYVYGLSYGTYLVEGLAHFAPASVKGFSVDGIVSESGDTVEKRSTFSNWDHDSIPCMAEDFCKSKFPGVTDLSSTTSWMLLYLTARRELTPVLTHCKERQKAFVLALIYLWRISSNRMRIAILAVIYRAARCSDADADALASFAESEDDAGFGDEEPETLLYDLLYYLIVFSEMWESPTPDKATLMNWYENSTMASDNFLSLPYYCLYTGSRERELPDGATVLMMTGGMDLQTRRMYGELGYEMMSGERVLVNFDDAGHCTTFTTPTKSGGCMDDLKPIKFSGKTVDSQEFFGTSDLYDSSDSDCPGGSAIRLEELPACMDDIRFQIDNQTAAFSVTSTANDLAAIIDYELSDQVVYVYVYGLSYGTYLVEGLAHFAPASVKGFSVDGIVSESGDTVEKRSTFSNWDHDSIPCMAEDFCKSKFPGVTDLSSTTSWMLLYLTARRELTPVLTHCKERQKAFVLALIYLWRISSNRMRIAILAVIYRAARCSDADADALASFAESEDDAGFGDEEPETLLYDLLYYLIVFSEMWESPTPDKATLMNWYENSTMASDNFLSLPYYSGNVLAKADPPPYCSASGTGELPDGATVLMMTGGMDLQTRRMYGELGYEMMSGERVLVNFDDAGHCTTFTTPTKSGGCMDDLKPIKFSGKTVDSQEFFGTSDLYDSSDSDCPGGSAIRLEELPATANDLAAIIDYELSDQVVYVYVYGLSYGTYLVEGLAHFAPASVKGFSVDGIVSESGDTVEKRSTFSNWDHDVGVVASRFLVWLKTSAKASFLV